MPRGGGKSRAKCYLTKRSCASTWALFCNMIIESFQQHISKALVLFTARNPPSKEQFMNKKLVTSVLTILCLACLKAVAADYTTDKSVDNRSASQRIGQ